MAAGWWEDTREMRGERKSQQTCRGTAARGASRLDGRLSSHRPRTVSRCDFSISDWAAILGWLVLSPPRHGPKRAQSLAAGTAFQAPQSLRGTTRHPAAFKIAPPAQPLRRAGAGAGPEARPKQQPGRRRAAGQPSTG